MNGEQKEVLNIIRQFKPKGISDIEAAINVISNHANKIKQQVKYIKRLEEGIKALSKEIDQ